VPFGAFGESRIEEQNGLHDTPVDIIIILLLYVTDTDYTNAAN
jgi:hypothetical protein